MNSRKGLVALFAFCLSLAPAPVLAQFSLGGVSFDFSGDQYSNPLDYSDYWTDVANTAQNYNNQFTSLSNSISSGSWVNNLTSSSFLDSLGFGGWTDPGYNFIDAASLGDTTSRGLIQRVSNSVQNSTINRALNSLPTTLPSPSIRPGPFVPTQTNPGITFPTTPGGSFGIPGGGTVTIGRGGINIGGTGGVRLPSATVSFPGAGSVTFGGPSQSRTSGSPTRRGIGNDSRSAGAPGQQTHHSSGDDANAAWIDHWNQPYAPELRPVPNGQTNKTGRNGEATMNMLYRTGMETSTMLLAPGTVTDRPFPSGSFDLGFPARNITPTQGYDPWRGQDQLGALQTQASTSTSSVDADITNGYE